jgi:hypothetical protein
MATSTNYGWSEPDNTSLVKDGAQAIRTLGDAIDTTMATKAVASNPVINSSFQVWQRGTSFVPTASGVYCADRWQSYRSVAGSTITRQVTNDTTNLPFIQYCTRVQRDSGNTSVQPILYVTSLESVNAIPFAGKTINFSFYARAGTNYSPTSSVLTAQLRTGTGTDQNALMTGYTGTANTISQNATLTTTWQRFQYSATLPTTTTEFAPYFTMTPVGTAGANDYYEITGVQIDLNAVALPFRTNGTTFQGELAMCQRYYVRQISQYSAYSNYGFGYAVSTTTTRITLSLPVTMRVAPLSIDVSSNLGLYDGTTITLITALTIAENNAQTPSLNATVASGLTQFRPYTILSNNNTSTYIGLSAEL